MCRFSQFPIAVRSPQLSARRQRNNETGKSLEINCLQALSALTSSIHGANLTAMKTWLPALVLSFVCQAHASPAHGEFDNMDDLLTGKGLVTRVQEQMVQTRDAVSEAASSLVIAALGFLDVPYRYGGNSADAGLDCSGFVRLVFEQSVGQVLPRRAADQAAATQSIERQELQPGDLVFFNTMRRAFSHVGIYVGEGRFIHAPRAGAQVRVEDMRVAYWNTRFNGARRVLSAEAQATR